MPKKLVMACAVAASFGAFMLPSTASALPVVTHPTGTVLQAGKQFLGTLVNGSAILTSGTGLTLVECNVATMTGTLITNSTAAGVSANIESAIFTGTEPEAKCKGSLGATKITTTGFATGLPWCATATKAEDIMEFRGGKCSEKARTLTFILDTPAAECKFEATTSMSAALQTDEGGVNDLVINFHKQGPFDREGTNLLCPVEFFFDASFTLETDVGLSEPLYLSH